MLDISLGEIALILLVAVLVIGPKELPTVVHHLAGWVRKARHFSQHLTAQFSALDQSGEIEKLRAELQEHARFIKDAEGKLYRTYDISDLMPPESSLPLGEVGERSETDEGSKDAATP